MRPIRPLFALVLALALLSGALLASADPTTHTTSMQPGDQLIVECNGAFQSDTFEFDPGYAEVDCVASGNTVGPEPTSTPAPDPTTTPDATPTPIVDHDHGSMHTWHAPGTHDGLPNHEHGDAPPAWVLDAGYEPMFTHEANTPNENVYKHTAMKGFAGTLNGVDVYVIAHLDTHPNGQQTRFHSYQLWMQDPSGGVSHIHGWMDFGDGLNELPNIRPVDTCEGQSIRPIIQVNFPECEIVFENWYSRASAWGPDFGFNISPQYYGGPQQGTLSSGSLDDMDTWLPTGNTNLTRRMEMAWYADSEPRRGTFWTDQFGRTLSGPDDPLVGTTITTGSRTYTTIALEQYIAPTAVSIQFPGNSFQKSYPVPQPFALPN